MLWAYHMTATQWAMGVRDNLSPTIRLLSVESLFTCNLGLGSRQKSKTRGLRFFCWDMFWGQNSLWSHVCLQLMDILDSLDKKVNVGLCMTSVSHHFSAPFLFTFMKSFIIQLPHLRWADLLMRTSLIRRDPEEKEGEIYVKLEALIHRPIWWYIHLLYVIAQSSGM